MVELREWLIRKDGYYYRPDCSGYTKRKVEAGRYTKAEADLECSVEPWHMKAIHQDDVPDEPAIADRDARLAELEAENERMTKERDNWERHATTGDQVLARTRDKLALAEAQRDEALKALDEIESIINAASGRRLPIISEILDLTQAARRVREGGKADG